MLSRTEARTLFALAAPSSMSAVMFTTLRPSERFISVADRPSATVAATLKGISPPVLVMRTRVSSACLELPGRLFKNRRAFYYDFSWDL